MWGFIILPIVLIAVGIIWFLLHRENKAISKAQADGLETRTKFGIHDGGNDATAIRNISSMI